MAFNNPWQNQGMGNSDVNPITLASTLLAAASNLTRNQGPNLGLFATQLAMEQEKRNREMLRNIINPLAFSGNGGGGGGNRGNFRGMHRNNWRSNDMGRNNFRNRGNDRRKGNASSFNARNKNKATAQQEKQRKDPNKDGNKTVAKSSGKAEKANNEKKKVEQQKDINNDDNAAAAADVAVDGEVKGDEDETEKDTSPYAGLPSSLLHCTPCNKDFTVGTDFESHLKTEDHANLMKLMNEANQQKVELFRLKSRVEENRYRISKNKSETTKNHCAMCNLHVFGTVMSHRKNVRHLQLKTYLHPECKSCNGKKFTARTDWEEHRLSPEHLKALHKANRTVADDEEEYEIEILRHHKKEEEEKVEPEMTKEELLAYKIPEEHDPNTSVGLNYVRPVHGFFCRLCKKFLSGDRTEHCKDKVHFQRFTETIKIKQAKAQAEAEAASKRKAEKNKAEDEDDDSGNWKRAKISGKKAEDEEEDEEENEEETEKKDDPKEEKEEDEEEEGEEKEKKEEEEDKNNSESADN